MTKRDPAGGCSAEGGLAFSQMVARGGVAAMADGEVAGQRVKCDSSKTWETRPMSL